ncbi:hypothetical protein QQ045_031227 [Rhodiola kirilowii]
MLTQSCFCVAELRERVSVQAHHTLKESTKMVATALPSIHDGKLMIRGKVVLTEVPSNIVVSQASDDSAFLGATSACESSRHVFNLGVLKLVSFIFSVKVFSVMWLYWLDNDVSLSLKPT